VSNLIRAYVIKTVAAFPRDISWILSGGNKPKIAGRYLIAAEDEVAEIYSNDFRAG
jgi:hypothetical protein